MFQNNSSAFIQTFSQLPLYRKLYISGLIVLALGLPLSAILTSVSQFILLGTWIIEGNFKNKLSKFKNNRILQAFLLLPFIHIVWLINTSDLLYALHDLKIKIPLLLFPFILGTIEPLNKSELKWVFHTFIAGVFMGSVASTAAYTGIYEIEYTSIRSISLFISHIRFGLMIVFSLLILGYYLRKNWLTYSKKTIVLNVLLILWLFTFLVILQSMTSWIVIVVLAFYLSIRFVKKTEKTTIKLTIITLISLLFIGTFGLVTKIYHDFYKKETYSLNELPKITKKGNKYYHKKNAQLKENGHYINVLICSKEIEETWPKVSSISLDSIINNYTLKSTLIRYLSSKGLTKDEEGILSLEKEDIKLIENGSASYINRYKFIPYIKIYDLIWEIDRYIKLGDANDKSFVQRIEFLRAAKYVIGKNLWFGVGTGDIQHAYQSAYKEIDSKLKKQNQLRTHNQLVTFAVVFGLIGFIFCLFSVFYPAVKYSGYNKSLLTTFMIILTMSMLNEDTLETQAGVTFYISFYTLMVFSGKYNYDKII